MCLSPITIPNPSRRFVDGISKYRQQVPCGCCKDCLKQQQDDWFVRAFFEYKRVKDAGGDAWFPLLTYRDEELPEYHDEEFDFHMPAFRREDIKKFRDKFRTILTRAGYDASGIRYMSDPEYGEEKGRSHFHMLLFIPFKLTIEQMFGTKEKNYEDGFLQRAWKHGYVSYRSKKVGGRGPIIESEGGIQYAFKYQWKRDPWYEFYGIEKYKKQLKDKIMQCKRAIQQYKAGDALFCELTKEFIKYRDRMKEFRNAEPRRSQSTYFGAEGLNYFADGKIDFNNLTAREAIAKAKTDGTFNTDKCVDGHIDLTECGRTPNPNRPAFKFNMPRYYVRKIFYNVDEYDLWVKTPFALEVASMRYDIKNQRKAEKFAPYFGVYELFHAHTQFYDLSEVKHNHDCNNDKELFNLLQNLISGRSAHTLAVYDTVYRGISPDSSWMPIATDLTAEEQFTFLRDNALDFMLSQQSIDVEPSPKRKARKVTDPSFMKPHMDFSQMACFADFDKLIELIEEIEQVIGKAQDEAWKLQEKRAQEVAKQNVVYFNRYRPDSFII